MENEKDVDSIMRNRRIAKKNLDEAASKGVPLAGMVLALEAMMSPFFLGVDESEDDSDLDVFP